MTFVSKLLEYKRAKPDLLAADWLECFRQVHRPGLSEEGWLILYHAERYLLGRTWMYGTRNFTDELNPPPGGLEYDKIFR